MTLLSIWTERGNAFESDLAQQCSRIGLGAMMLCQDALPSLQNISTALTFTDTAGRVLVTPVDEYAEERLPTAFKHCDAMIV
jgi:hypothetical protein